jgi:hypothetical protein
MEFIEPLLRAPAVNGKGQNPDPAVTTGTQTESRLACAVNEMWRIKGGLEDGNRRLLTELVVALKTVGIQSNQPLRKKLKKLVRNTTL